MNWQPIESAPRGRGERVLLYRVGFAESMAVGWWNTFDREWAPVNGSVFPEPTHWMPLPQPPEAA